MIKRAENHMTRVANALNYLAAAAVLAMMLLTTLDVILRFFRCPISGTYEMVGYLGALTISLALATTSLNSGHIAVDVFMKRLPKRLSFIIDRLNLAAAAGMFLVITWYLVRYAADSRSAGEVSMTLQIPVYPFIYGVATGCAALSVVLMVQLFASSGGAVGDSGPRREEDR